MKMKSPDNTQLQADEVGFVLPLIVLTCQERLVQNHFHRSFRSFRDAHIFLRDSGYIIAGRLYSLFYTVDMTSCFSVHGEMVLAHPEDKEFYDEESMHLLNHCIRETCMLLDRLGADDPVRDLVEQTLHALRAEKLEIPVYDPEAL